MEKNKNKTSLCLCSNITCCTSACSDQPMRSDASLEIMVGSHISAHALRATWCRSKPGNLEFAFFEFQTASKHLKSTHIQLQSNRVDRFVERPGELVLPQGFQDDILHELQLVGLPALLVWVRHRRGRGIPEPRRVRLGVRGHDGGRLWTQQTSQQMYTGRFLLPVQQLVRGRSDATSLHCLSGRWIIETVTTPGDQWLFFCSWSITQVFLFVLFCFFSLI